MGYSTDIAGQKQEILNLLEKLHQGSAKTKSKKQEDREAETTGPSLQDRIRRRRQDLLDLRDRRERLGQDLLEERLLNICQMLEERIARIESAIGRGAPRAKAVQDVESADGTDIAANLGAMTPDLDIAIPTPEAAQSPMDLGLDLISSDQSQPEQETPTAALSGLVQDGILPDILQMISSNTKTGIFTLEADGKKIDLFLQDGEMYHAVTEDMTGQTAFFAAMAMEEGKFYFHETDEVPEEKTIDGNTQFMILEALRQIDEEQGGA